MNRPIKGYGGTDKLQCGLAGVAGAPGIQRGECWHPAAETWIDGPGTWDSRCLWGWIYGGISQLALALVATFILHSGVTETGSVVPASDLPTHVSVCPVSFWTTRKKKNRRNRVKFVQREETVCKSWRVTPTTDANVIDYSIQTERQTQFSLKMSENWKIFMSTAARVLI